MDVLRRTIEDQMSFATPLLYPVSSICGPGLVPGKVSFLGQLTSFLEILLQVPTGDLPETYEFSTRSIPRVRSGQHIEQYNPCCPQIYSISIKWAPVIYFRRH
eukprot:11271607-Ditylum_brightwellii.AAC.1